MRRLLPTTRLYLGLVLFCLLGSLLSKSTGLRPGIVAPIASAVTLIVGCAAVFASPAKADRRGTVRSCIAVLLLGLAVELIGLNTGWPFGKYQYTEAWQPVVRVGEANFPVLLPMAWLLVAGAAYSLAQEWVSSLWGRAIVAGMLAAVLDLVMEPVMSGPLGYWRWLQKGPLPGDVPIANLFGWLFTGTTAGLIFALSIKRGFCPRQAAYVLAGHLVLTLGLGAIIA